MQPHNRLNGLTKGQKIAEKCITTFFALVFLFFLFDELILSMF